RKSCLKYWVMPNLMPEFGAFVFLVLSRLGDAVPGILEHIAIPCRIDIKQWVVEGIAIPVVTLKIIRCLNRRIRTEEPPRNRIVDSAVHMNYDLDPVSDFAVRTAVNCAGEGGGCIKQAIRNEIISSLKQELIHT